MLDIQKELLRVQTSFAGFKSAAICRILTTLNLVTRQLDVQLSVHCMSAWTRHVYISDIITHYLIFQLNFQNKPHKM